MKTMTKMNRCWRCNGTGEVSWAKHVSNGICFLCKGKGEVEGCGVEERDGVTSLSRDGVVWQFRAAKRMDDGEVRNCPKGLEPSWVIVQAIKGNGRNGLTFLRSCSTVEKARDLYRSLVGGAGVNLETLKPEDLGLRDEKWQWTMDGDPCVRWTRNRPGVDWL